MVERLSCFALTRHSKCPAITPCGLRIMGGRRENFFVEQLREQMQIVTIFSELQGLSERVRRTASSYLATQPHQSLRQSLRCLVVRNRNRKQTRAVIKVSSEIERSHVIPASQMQIHENNLRTEIIRHPHGLSVIRGSATISISSLFLKSRNRPPRELSVVRYEHFIGLSADLPRCSSPDEPAMVAC
jgi:hypothetical protein